MEIRKRGIRTYELSIEGKKINTPAFIPSVSSTVAYISPYEALDILMQKNSNSFLFSAFDYHYETNIENRKKLKYILETASKRGTIVFLDSGGFEALYSKKEWSFKEFLETVEQIDADAYFSYDNFTEDDVAKKNLIDTMAENSVITMAAQNSGITIPILHLSSSPWNQIIPKVVQYLHPQILAIPEKELGIDLEERAKQIKEIRTMLDREHSYIPLHILGVGKPIPILTYSIAGADLFDGLSWLTNVINPKDLSTIEVEMSNFSPIQCNCNACLSKAKYPNSWKFKHNLDFLSNFTSEIRSKMEEGKIIEIFETYGLSRELLEVLIEK